MATCGGVGPGTLGLVVYIAIPFLLFLALRFLDLRRPKEARDEWGPWGILIMAGALGFIFSVAFLIMASANAYQVSCPDPTQEAWAATAVSILGVVYMVMALWGRRRRMAEGLG